MFDILSKYKTDHFFFRKCDLLEQVCNAPKDSCGVFLVYKLAHGRVELVYIGSTREVSATSCKTGLFDNMVNEPDFNAIPGKIFFYLKLIEDDADALDIYWYETSSDKPEKIAKSVLNQYSKIQGDVPAWNK